MTDRTAVTPETVQQMQTRIGWLPAIPEPFYVWGRPKCDCGKSFRGRQGKQRYREHYLYQHIVCGTAPL